MWSCIGVILIAAVGIQAQLPTSTRCLCIRYNLCTTNNTISQDGANLLTSRVGVYTEEDCTCPRGNNGSRMDCSDPLHLCCKVPVDTEKPQPITEKPHDNNNNDTDDVLSWNDCGSKGMNPSDSAGNGRMLTLEGEFPWMAMVLNKKNNEMLCGGSILDHHVIMTAAHCVKGMETNLLVRVGVWDRENVEAGVTAQVERVLLHQEFDASNYRNDIALLVLKQGLQRSEAVAPICLPQADTSYDNMLCWATGWGVSNYIQSNHSRTLRKVHLKIIPRSQCQKELRESRLGPFFKVHNSFVCANGDDKADTCTGDGGGPLICLQPSTNKYVQVGIVSTGYLCNTGIPALYANVPHLLPWIQGKFNEWNLRTLDR